MIYLDHAAMSYPKPPEVEAATIERLRSCGNPGRGGHRLSVESEGTLDAARLALHRLLGGDSARRFALTLNGTDALHLAIHAALGAPHDRTPHVVTTAIEHNSVARPLNQLLHHGRIRLTVVETGADAIVDPEAVAAALEADTALVAVTHASNALGTLQPIEAIAAVVRANGDALVLVDAAQSVGAMPIDLDALGADLVAFPGHKALLAPTGTGALWIGPRAQPDLDAGTGSRLDVVRTGGTGDSRDPLMPPRLPQRFEAGTPNVIGAAGLAAGAEWVRAFGPERIREHETTLMARLGAALDDRRDVRLVGAADATTRLGVASLALEEGDPAEVAAALDAAFEIAVRPGLHCAPGAHRTVGTHPDGTIRVSVGHSTTIEEIDAFLEALADVLSARAV